MSIRINSSNIQIGAYFLEETSTGLSFSGVTKASAFASTNTPLQGTVSGYTSGGQITNPLVTGMTNVVDKFPFAAATTNATDAGDLSGSKGYASSQSSQDSGYVAGGYPGPVHTNVIDRFPFSSFTTATNIGNLNNSIRGAYGHSSPTSGYAGGGLVLPASLPTDIQRFPFASGSVSTVVVGATTGGRYQGAGISSATHGYSAGTHSPADATIEKYSFISESNATNVGTLEGSNSEVKAGVSSYTHGYVQNGSAAPGATGYFTVQKFPFANDMKAVGVLSAGNSAAAGTGSTTYGYIMGGGGGPSFVNVIERFPYADNTIGADVGDLTQSRLASASQQD